MDSVDLIARENEFKKLNKQLERKTESLMKEIQEVMQRPDIFSAPNLKLNFYKSKTDNFSNNQPKDSWRKNHVNISKNNPDLKIAMQQNLIEEQTSNDCHSVESFKKSDSNCLDVSSTSAGKLVCDCCVKEHMTDELQFLYAFVSVSVKDNVLPQSFLKGRVTAESVCKCLSAKIKLMQERLDTLQAAAAEKNKQCEAHLTHVAELESERLALSNTANTMRSEAADTRAKYLAIQNRLDDKERLYKEQRSATDKLSVEIKQYKSKSSSLEARCASLEETAAALRQQLEAAKLSEKEYRNCTRSLSSSHEATIKRLECQLSALRTRMSQQRALIANLRAQRMLLGAERAVQTLSAQYCRLLEHGE